MPKRNFEFDEPERLALAYVAAQELRTNRYPLSPQLEPLRRALAKLAPEDELPKPPVTPQRGSKRR